MSKVVVVGSVVVIESLAPSAMVIVVVPLGVLFVVLSKATSVVDSGGSLVGIVASLDMLSVVVVGSCMAVVGKTLLDAPSVVVVCSLVLVVVTCADCSPGGFDIGQLPRIWLEGG
jgi:hypothetical protein